MKRPTSVFDRVHWPGTAILLAQLATIVESPLVLNRIPAHWAAVATLGIAFAQALTKAIHTKGKE
jgi:hypothetical protein